MVTVLDPVNIWHNVPDSAPQAANCQMSMSANTEQRVSSGPVVCRTLLHVCIRDQILVTIRSGVALIEAALYFLSGHHTLLLSVPVLKTTTSEAFSEVYQSILIFGRSEYHEPVLQPL